MKNKEIKYIAVNKVDYYWYNIILILIIVTLISLQVFQLYRNETLENRNRELESNYNYLLNDYNSIQKVGDK